MTSYMHDLCTDNRLQVKNETITEICHSALGISALKALLGITCLHH